VASQPRFLPAPPQPDMGYSPIRLEAKVCRHQLWYSQRFRAEAESLPPSNFHAGWPPPSFTISGWWIPASVCRPPPCLLNHLHPEGLGSSRVHYAWRHRLLRPQLPVSAPPLDFPFRLYERSLPYGTLLAGTETFPLSLLLCLTMPSSFDPGDADKCNYPVLPCRWQPSPEKQRLGHPKTHDSL